MVEITWSPAKRHPLSANGLTACLHSSTAIEHNKSHNVTELVTKFSMLMICSRLLQAMRCAVRNDTCFAIVWASIAMRIFVQGACRWGESQRVHSTRDRHDAEQARQRPVLSCCLRDSLGKVLGSRFCGCHASGDARYETRIRRVQRQRVETMVVEVDRRSLVRFSQCPHLVNEESH